MNFDSVTPEFKSSKRVHPSWISSLATFAWPRHCCNQYCSFVGWSVFNCFTYSL